MRQPYFDAGDVTLWHGDCVDVMAELDAVDAVVTDPPYGLAFMGRSWDDFDPAEYQQWCQKWGEAALSAAKPGAHLLAFGGARTSHRLVCGLEDAGWKIRDALCWLYGTGFPKSHDVSKAIDKAAGVEPDRVTENPDRSLGGLGSAGWNETPRQHHYDTPTTEAAKRWEGFGTALKPSHEPIVLARKPLGGTVAESVQQWGTGALNIDGCRIGASGGGGNGLGSHYDRLGNTEAKAAHGEDLTGVMGRWPANVVLDREAAAMLDQQAGHSVSRRGKPRSGVSGDGYGLTHTGAEYDNSGGPSRFFYTSKASTAEKPWESGDEVMHPTVKPLDLMRWLVRLVTPPGGTVLDPFAGTGTTGEACVIEGFKSVLIEQSEDYCDLAVRRLSKPIQPTLQ